MRDETRNGVVIKELKGKPKNLIPRECVIEFIKAAHGKSECIYAKEAIKAAYLYNDEPDALQFCFRSINSVLQDTQNKGKYPKDSWKECDFKLFIDAYIRHISKDQLKPDEESGILTIAHTLCNLMFLTWFDLCEQTSTMK